MYMIVRGEDFIFRVIFFDIIIKLKYFIFIDKYRNSFINLVVLKNYIYLS